MIRSLSTLFVGFLMSASVCGAATLSLGATGAHAVGETFTVPVYVSAAAGESLNAVSATVTFPPQKLRVALLNDTGIVDLWAQKPAYSNADGTVTFQGVTYNPGFSGARGTVLSITFRAISSGTAQLAFDSASVLANDGQGTEILANAAGAPVELRDAAPVAPAPPPAATHSSPASRPAEDPRTMSNAAPPPASTSPATSSMQEALFDVSAQPEQPVAHVSVVPDVLMPVLLVVVAIILAGTAFFFVWYVWHRAHRTRRRFVRRIAATDSALHAELFELHDAIKDEVARLLRERVDRDLTTEEKRILTRFAHLVEKTERVLQESS